MDRTVFDYGLPIFSRTSFRLAVANIDSKWCLYLYRVDVNRECLSRMRGKSTSSWRAEVGNGPEKSQSRALSDETSAHEPYERPISSSAGGALLKERRLNITPTRASSRVARGSRADAFAHLANVRGDRNALAPAEAAPDREFSLQSWPAQISDRPTRGLSAGRRWRGPQVRTLC